MMKGIKKGLRAFADKVGIGFSYGIGFGLSFMAICLAMSGVVYGCSDSDYIEYDSQDYMAAIEIQTHSVRREEFHARVLGRLKNNSEERFNHVEFVVNLFDADGNLVEQCTDTLTGTAAAGATRHFKVDCSGCPDSPLVDFATYTIEVVEASTRPW